MKLMPAIANIYANTEYALLGHFSRMAKNMCENGLERV